MPRARKSTTGGAVPSSVNGIPTTATGTPSRSRRATRVSTPAQAPLAPAPMADEIARRAYEIYEQSGFRQGQDLDHWLIAERELQEL